jgi:hypothetical protein
MSQKYFSNFPLINYNDSATRNIILKAQFFKQVIDSVGAFYTYVVRDGERPDSIAYDYYGHSDYSWIVYFSNSIVDPYFEWPMDSFQFQEFIIKKYGSIPAAIEEIVYYVYNDAVDPTDPEYEYNLSYKMDTVTYNYKVANEQSFQVNRWIEKNAYDYELEKNDDNRNIKLLDSAYLGQINREISNIFKK